MLDKNMLFLTKVQIDLKCHIAVEPDTSLNCLSPLVYGFLPTAYTTALQDPQSAEPVDARRPRRETLRPTPRDTKADDTHKMTSPASPAWGRRPRPHVCKSEL